MKQELKIEILQKRIDDLEKTVDRYRALEEKLRESEELYKSISQKSFAGIYVVQNGRFCNANANAASYAGYAIEELVGRESDFVIHPEDKADVKENARAMLRGDRTAPHIFRIITKQGAIRWIMETVTSISFGGRPAILGNSMDITEHMLAEDRLRESENLYRAIFETTGTATIIIEEDTTVSLVNSEFVRLSNYSKEDWEGKKSWTEFVVPKDVERMKTYHSLRRIDPNAAPRNYEFGFIDSRGYIKNVILTVGMIPGTKKSVASFADITEMKLAAQKIRESENLYRAIFETTGTATIIIEEDTTISLGNTEFWKLSGYDREKVEGKKRWTYVIAREDQERMLGYHHQRRIQPKAVPRNYECRLIRKDSEMRTCHMTVALIPGTSQSVASFLDITERINAEEALRVSEQKFAKAFRSGPAAVAIASIKDGRYIEINESFLRITGYCREEIIGHTSLELNIWPTPEYRKDLIRKLLERGNQKIHEINFRVKSGEMRHGLCSGEIIDLQDEPCLIFVFADITRQRRLEKEILDISERERQKIGQDLHDDLQQHLIGIEALGTLLENRLEQQARPEAALAKEIVELIRGATAKTRTLARGLCPLDLDEDALFLAIRELMASVNKIFGVSCLLNIGKTFRIRDNATAIHLYRIIQESVNNAIRHGKAGQIRITLTSRKGVISVKIADNGLGMKEDPSAARGLGLRLMKHRAGMIGAFLAIDKNPKGGTVITCTLNQKS